MKKTIFLILFSLALLISCNKDEAIMESLQQYNLSMEEKGYHFGDPIVFPQEVTERAESISISFGDKETSDMVIDPNFFTLGDNAVTINITRNGKVFTQDATIYVFAKNPEQNLTYEIIAEYPHDPNNFVQGFQLEGNTVYESDGQEGESRILKYTLGSISPLSETRQDNTIFSEGSTIVGNRIYQLTWKNRKGFIYDKAGLKLQSEFSYPNILSEGWGLTYDGKDLWASDGSKNLYVLDVNDPSQLLRYISVAGHQQVFDQLNELEYHNGFIYANVWQKPIVIKIDPKSGEVVAKLDFTLLAAQQTKGTDDVLNGIAFKGDNMLVTGKNWSKIYEVSIK